MGRLRRPLQRNDGQSKQTTAMSQYFCLDDWVQRIVCYAPSTATSICAQFASNCGRSTVRSVGRPSIPKLLRILLIGYLYGITSERQLLYEIGLNLAYRCMRHCTQPESQARTC